MDGATINKGEKKMTNEIQNEISWTTKRGTEIKVISGLKLGKKIYADGYLVEVDCCEKTLKVEVNGKHHPAHELSTFGYPKTINGNTVLANLGRMYLTDQSDVDKIQALIAKTESHPAWIEKQAKIEKNIKEIAAMESNRVSNGYCNKCGSYCYGDCEA